MQMTAGPPEEKTTCGLHRATSEVKECGRVCLAISVVLQGSQLGTATKWLQMASPLDLTSSVTPARFIKIGDKEVEYHPSFRLILHTKYFNPHYKPEMQAQCTLINFLVTRDGLEDQLLAAVVAKERPDLEQLKANLTKSQNEFKIVLKELEDSLLARLSAASGNFLGDTALVENLETTKHTASEIEEKVGASSWAAMWPSLSAQEGGSRA
ncbi:dynein heavy chain 17, axonemal-like, partial [Octodon degus]|uniref:Dynein heavy chain 17, axonemal-like n=1 Tax=Octodon degus TaxID=10160 RepID=A0A6P6DWY2_OCTDE